MATVDKYYDKYFLVINSLERVNPFITTSSDFKIQLAYPMRGYIARMRLLSCTIPNVIDLFTTGKNNNLFFIDSSGSNNIIIPDGNYSLTELILLLQNSLNSASPDTYTVTFNSNTLKLNITSTFAGFQIDTTNVDSPYYELGLIPNNLTAASAVQDFPNAIDLSGTNRVFISLDNVNRDIHNVDNINVSTFVVEMTSCYGELNYHFHRTHTEQEYYFSKNIGRKYNISEMSVQLIDGFGQLVDLKGKNWQCVIEYDLDPNK